MLATHFQICSTGAKFAAPAATGIFAGAMPYGYLEVMSPTGRHALVMKNWTTTVQRVTTLNPQKRKNARGRTRHGQMIKQSFNAMTIAMMHRGLHPLRTGEVATPESDREKQEVVGIRRPSGLFRKLYSAGRSISEPQARYWEQHVLDYLIIRNQLNVPVQLSIFD
ncbi:hypothetical protein CEP52_016724 [Fusarium oligoseptatum]|uniref:Uncharacterized protein n=1 Tax=Fusarium oligoseptatum TaxID=2604345 RepID=A0A428S0L8_9HYPO|nr:hypothetical protein CEP52_016724 [Fusarium oligoseptatum]